MSRLDPRRARAVVEARLGRPVQDSLEAAVVLEAWCGCRLATRSASGRKLIGHVSGPAPRGRHIEEQESVGAQRGSGGHLAGARDPRGGDVGLAAQLRAGRRRVGQRGADRAPADVRAPVDHVEQAPEQGRGARAPCARRDRPVSSAWSRLPRPSWSFAATPVAVAALLLVTWVGGTVLVSRGWGALVCARARGRGHRARTSTSILMRCSAAPRSLHVAVVSGDRDRLGPASGASPGQLGAGQRGGRVGAGLGALLVTDDTIGWGFFGALPALALIPPRWAGLWGGRHLDTGPHRAAPALRGDPGRACRQGQVRGAGLVILARIGPAADAWYRRALGRMHARPARGRRARSIQVCSWDSAASHSQRCSSACSCRSGALGLGHLSPCAGGARRGRRSSCPRRSRIRAAG